MNLRLFLSMQSMSDRLASRTIGAELTLSPHSSVHKDFARYEELMGWLKDLDRDKYFQVKKVCHVKKCIDVFSTSYSI